MAITVHVKNFQSIEDATVEIANLTVITGPNNTGKSALMRAITGVFTNMDGHAFVRNGTTHCEVTISFEDGQTVKWEKGKNHNQYILNEGTPQEKKISKVGRGNAPQEVMDMGIGFVTIGDGSGSDGKLWPQIAPQWLGQVFLLDRTGAVMAEAISDTDRVGRLNRSLRGVESDHRSIGSKLKVRRVDKEEAEVKLQKYVGLNEVVGELERLGQVEKGLVKMVTAIRVLDGKRTLRNQALNLIDKFKGLDAIVIPDHLSDIKKIRVQIREAKELSLQYQKANKWITKYQGLGADFTSFELCVEKAQRAQQSVAKVRELQRDRGNYLSQISQNEKKILDLQASIAEVGNTILQLESELSEERQKCPTCGSPLVEGHND